MDTDKTTPYLEVEGQRAVLSGSEFLSGREAQLQARLDELARELAGLEDVPDDVEALEQQAADGLRALMGLLEPPARPMPVTVAQHKQGPDEQPAPLPEPSTPRIAGRRVGFAAILLLAVVATAIVVVLQGLPLLIGMGADPTATAAPSTPTRVLASTPRNTVAARPTKPPPTATPLPPPTDVAPVLIERPLREQGMEYAQLLQILDVSGTLRLELPLAVMTETIQLVEGVPVLRPQPPAHGAGLHRGSAPFGRTGTTVIALPSDPAAADLWQTRPGDQLIGCNSDEDCHEYRITAVETWPLEQVRRTVDQWPAGAGVLLYVIRETDAWVIQATPLQEGRR